MLLAYLVTFTVTVHPFEITHRHHPYTFRVLILKNVFWHLHSILDKAPHFLFVCYYIGDIDVH